jgi:NodT family efflux transporter outer membrane factor (OMF) lipoprotein
MAKLKLSTYCVLAFACTTIVGCAVGPDYQRPNLPESKGYVIPTEMPVTGTRAASQLDSHQRLAVGAEIRNDWWTLFRSPALNALIEQAFAANPTIEIAQQALKVAQQNVYAQQGYFFPTVQANYMPTRTKLPGNLGGNSPGVQGDGNYIGAYQGTPANQGGTAPYNGSTVFNFHTAQLTVGYLPDLFGLNRRAVESLQAQTDAQKFQLQAAYITLASNIVAAAVQDGMLRKQISITQDMIEANETAVALVKRQQKSGYASQLDFSIQESALGQVKQLLPPLQKQFEQNRDLLKVLAGRTQDQDIPAFDLAAFKLPDELPLTLPSQLVEQRPDIQAAEQLLRAANAQIGVARATRFPQLSLSGTLGGTASNFNQMFWAGSGGFFELALNLAQPIFAGGTLMHREYAATEAQKQAAAQYRLTVITAFQNVADTLHAIKSDAQALTIVNDLTAAAKKTYELSGRQHANGYLDRLALINAQQTYRQALLNTTQIQGSRLGNTAALFQALGGGWWNKPAGQ